MDDSEQKCRLDGISGATAVLVQELRHTRSPSDSVAAISSISGGRNQKTGTHQSSEEETRSQSTPATEDVITVLVPELVSRSSPTNLDLSLPESSDLQDHEPTGRVTPEVMASTDPQGAAGDVAKILNKRRRTRRGCLICRRRRKKCDEVKPICKALRD
jgi:hypothetical protein